MFTSSQLIFAQSSAQQLPFFLQKESIKILSPVTTQNATVGKDLIISGQSSDDVVKNCSVSVIVKILDPTKMPLREELRGRMIFLDGNSL